MQTRKKIKEKLDNIEENASTYFEKLNKIEEAIREGQASKTPSVFIVERIKEVIKK